METIKQEPTKLSSGQGSDSSFLEGQGISVQSVPGLRGLRRIQSSGWFREGLS